MSVAEFAYASDSNRGKNVNNSSRQHKNTWKSGWHRSGTHAPSEETMLGLNRQQRALLANKVPEVMNITSGAIVVGFAIGNVDASWIVLATAIGLWIASIVFALWLMKHRT
ncbi:MAG: hypothetical protein HYU37_06930 [Acidobacteria bacterium]|nr:hypothetical protein [Acidobacteriota bacterium]